MGQPQRTSSRAVGGVSVLTCSLFAAACFTLGAIWGSTHTDSGRQSEDARESVRRVFVPMRLEKQRTRSEPESTAPGSDREGAEPAPVPIWVADLLNHTVFDFEGARAAGDGRFFKLSQYSLMNAIYTRLLGHPWRVKDSSEAKVLFIPGWESCDSRGWANDGPCSQELQQLLAIKPLPSQRVIVTASSRVNRWAYRHPFIWNTTFYKLTPEDMFEGSCEKVILGDTWIPVPDMSSALRPCEPRPFTPKPMSMRTIACEMGSRAWRTTLIEGCKAHLEVKYNNPLVTSNILSASGLMRYEETMFSFQPVGDSCTRKGTMDALAMGNIPIIFKKCSFGYELFYPFDEANGTILLHLPLFDQNVSQIVDYVKTLPDSKVLAMQKAVYDAGGRLGYSGCPQVKTDDLITTLIRRVAELDMESKCPLVKLVKSKT